MRKCKEMLLLPEQFSGVPTCPLVGTPTLVKFHSGDISKQNINEEVKNIYF